MMNFNNRCIELIDSYRLDEFGTEDSCKDENLKSIGVAYTTFGDDEQHEMHVHLDIIGRGIIYDIYNGDTEESYQECDTLKDEDFIEFLEGMNFQDLYSTCLDIADEVWRVW